VNVPARQRIAVVGAGVSRLAAAWLLDRRHEVTPFEAAPEAGGHTVQVDDPRGSLPIDTGFIVFNQANYPLFTRVLDRLGIESQPTDMSSSVRCERPRVGGIALAEHGVRPAPQPRAPGVLGQTPRHPVLRP